MLKRLKQITLNTLKYTRIFQLVLNSKWRQERLFIIAYHGISIEDEHDFDSDLFMSPDLFRSRMELLKLYECNVLPLKEGVSRLYEGRLPRNSIVLTFDDGYYNFYNQAYPIINEYKFPVTLYISTFYTKYNRPVFDCTCQYLLWKGRELTLDLKSVTGTNLKIDLKQKKSRSFVFKDIKDFCSRENMSELNMDMMAAKLATQVGIDYEALASKRIMNYLNPDEVRFLASRGVDFQIHTHRHHTSFNQQLFNDDVLENVRHIKAMSGTDPAHFCYPGGVYDKALPGWLADLNISTATTCEPGLASRNSNQLLLPRLVDVTPLTPIEFEGWMTGVSTFIPRRRHTYNKVSNLSETDIGNLQGNVNI